MNTKRFFFVSGLQMTDYHLNSRVHGTKVKKVVNAREYTLISLRDDLHTFSSSRMHQIKNKKKNEKKNSKRLRMENILSICTELIKART